MFIFLKNCLKNFIQHFKIFTVLFGHIETLFHGPRIVNKNVTIDNIFKFYQRSESYYFDECSNFESKSKTIFSNVK